MNPDMMMTPTPEVDHNSSMPGMGHNSSMPGMDHNSSMPGMDHNSSMPGMDHNSSMPGHADHNVSGANANVPSMHGNHGGAGGHEGMSPFLFTRTDNFFVLFREADIQSTGAFVGALLLSFFFAFLTTAISQFMRIQEGKALISGNTFNKFVAAILHGIRLLFHYTLMLIVMTMNVWLIIAVIGGTALGWFTFALFFGGRYSADAEAAQRAGAECAHD